MATIQVKDLNHPHLAKSLEVIKTKVLWKRMQDTVHCLNVMESLIEKINEGRKAYKEILDQYVETDAEGKPVLQENGSPKLRNEEEMTAKFKELLEKEVEILGRLDMSKIHDCKLTAEELEPVKFLFHV